MLNHLFSSNELQIKRVLDLILRRGKQKIGIFGSSFKAKTDDLRESPMVTLVEYLLREGKQLRIYDENLDFRCLTSSNKEYVEQKIPHLVELLQSDQKTIILESEVLVIGTKQEGLKDLPKQTTGKIIIDLVRIFEPGEATGKYIGITW